MSEDKFRIDIEPEKKDGKTTYIIKVGTSVIIGGFPDFGTASYWVHVWMRESMKTAISDKTRRDYLGAVILAGSKGDKEPS